jgi:uncharacterized iron-regulated protein
VSADSTESSLPPRCLTAGTWFDVKHQQNLHDPIALLASKTVVLLGESHDNAGHHRWQLDVATALFQRRPEIAFGFEMFPRRVQSVLDRWSKGELCETAFFRDVDWPRIWGFDPKLYLPLFRFARANSLHMVALNIDRETNQRVAAEGFAAISATDREGVTEPAPASAAYRDRLLTWFQRHSAVGAAAARFDRFVRAQLIWDRAMAEAIVGALRARPQSLIVGIMGSGHIEYGDGVPHQLAALNLGNVVTALPWPAGAESPVSDHPIADLVFGVGSLG